MARRVQDWRGDVDSTRIRRSWPGSIGNLVRMICFRITCEWRMQYKFTSCLRNRHGCMRVLRVEEREAA
jgi:hypothetical protein